MATSKSITIRSALFPPKTEIERTTVPTALGTAACGVSLKASASDHVHPLPSYDIIIAPSGGHYTSIAAAFTAGGGGKSYFISQGEYSEADDVTVPYGEGTYVYSAGAVVTMADGKYWVAGGAVSIIKGKLTIKGTGTAAGHRLLDATKDDLDWTGIEVATTVATSSASGGVMLLVLLGGKRQNIDVKIIGKSVNLDGDNFGACYARGTGDAVAECVASRYKVVCQGFTLTNAGAAASGLSMGASRCCLLDVLLEGNSGFVSGLQLNAANKYTTAIGAVYNCGTELVNSGTGNNVAGLTTGG